ncbi:MAG TPA: hypothetical protein DEQ61_21620 [Streptomyces sp.]|nr:hypothetical protein [Streptomyces sp.]
MRILAEPARKFADRRVRRACSARGSRPAAGHGPDGTGLTHRNRPGRTGPGRTTPDQTRPDQTGSNRTTP